jgi:prophage maintenance system killer protein
VQYLTVAEDLLMHARLVQRTGGSKGVRDVRLLESALARQSQHALPNAV